MFNVILSIVLFVYIVITLIVLDEVLHRPIVISEFKDEPKAAKYIICFIVCLFWPIIRAYNAYKKRNRHD